MYCWLCLNTGTGKSTLIRFIIAALNLQPQEVCYVAYTGKAAQVLKQKGCYNPITAHKLLYKAKLMPNGKYKFEAKSILDGEYKLIIVDEISMLPVGMWQLLLSHRVPVIACGDPEQLPPIDKDSNNNVLAHPHIFLDEIMRQAYDSEIIRFSMWIREGKPISKFPTSNKEVMLLSPSEVTTEMYKWADQILCATNATRNSINTTMRQLKGFGPEPQIGDKIISLHNQWEFFSNNIIDPSPLTNGSIGTIQKANLAQATLPLWICKQPISILYTTMEDENKEIFARIPIDYTALTTGEKILTGKQEYQLRKAKGYIDPPFDFAYAYALTTWKSQGSEWDKILGYEERFPFDAETHRKCAYTLATRAKEKLVWVRL